MTTPIAAAVAAVVAALQTAPVVCTVVDRVRLRAVAQNVNQAVAVRPLQSEVAQNLPQTGVAITLNTKLALDCYARVATGTAPDAAVDVLAQAAVARLQADPTLGGVVLQAKLASITYDFDAHDQLSACATLEVDVFHRTSGSDFTQPT